MPIAQALSQFWSERAPRERRILAVGAAFLALLVLYLAFVAPAAGGVVRLQRLLPQARAQAALLEALVAEARGLRKLAPTAVPTGGDARASLDKSLESAGLQASRREAANNGDLRFSFANVPYGKWAAWLAATERTLGVHAVSVRVKAGNTPGNADIELSLRPPRS